MFEPCSIPICKQTSRVLCHCCKENFCLEHLSNHNNLNNSQSNTLNIEINLLYDQLKKLNIEKLIDNNRLKLDKWKDDSIKKINQFYENKLQEIHQYYFEKIHQQQKNIDQLYKKLRKNTTHNELEILINDIKQEIDNIEKVDIPINIDYLSIDNNLIAIEEFDLTNLSLPHQIINCSENFGSAFGINDQYLLIEQNSILNLFDTNLKIIEQISWKYKNISDICWSSILSSFIIITEKNQTFLFNQNNFSINSIEILNNQLWLSCTCSNSLLYLTSYTNAIIEYNLLPSISYSRRWDPPITCQKNQFIKNINCNNDIIAIIIASFQNQMVDLMFRSLITFDQLFLINLDIKHPLYNLPIRCSLFKDNQWIIIDANTSKIFHIDKNKKLKGTITYNQTPYNAVLFDSNKLIIRTENSINFHHLFY